jgi:short-subunit dehydrogenase
LKHRLPKNGATSTPFHDIAKQPQPPQMSTPEDVVLAGLKALDKDQSYVIPGKLNFLLSAIMPRFLPRSTITMLAKKVMQTK